MKNYVVGFFDLFDPEEEVCMEKVQAMSEVEALRGCSFLKGYELPESADVDAIREIVFGCDGSISIIEV